MTSSDKPEKPGSSEQQPKRPSKSMGSDHRRQAVSTTGKKIRPVGATYLGSVPDTDPRYKSGWNYLSGKNLNPHLKERSADEAQEEAAPPVEPEKRGDE